MSETSESPSPTSWEEFASNPAATIAAGRLVPCFDGALSLDPCGRLAASPRLRARLNDLIQATYRLAPVGPAEACSETDRAIALAPASRLAEIARRSGAVFWSAAIAKAVVVSQLTALHEQLGEELHRFALAHRDLAGPPRSIEPIMEAGARIARDGWLCVGAWCHAQSEAVGARVLLKLSPDHGIDWTPESPFAELGPDIVRRAAS
jgi:YOP proteins translocation protein K (YscK)